MSDAPSTYLLVLNQPKKFNTYASIRPSSEIVGQNRILPPSKIVPFPDSRCGQTERVSMNP